MARPSKTDTQIRTHLETIMLEVVKINLNVPVVALRVSQAKERTGLTGLLSPALDDLDGVADAMSMIGEQVAAALSLLRE